MRLWPLVFCFAVVLACAARGFAQQPTGPATLEGLLNTDTAQKPTAAADADATEAGPKRPAGTASRPKDGVQHPDLDKAWAGYDAVIAKVNDSIKAAIAEQFDAATAKGDLDAAEKWQAALERFEKAGEVPSGKELKTVTTAAAAEYKHARDDLRKAYDTVTKVLTTEKNIAEARAVRDEALATSISDTPPDNGEQESGRKESGRKESGRKESGRKESGRIEIIDAKYGAGSRWRVILNEARSLVLGNDTLLISAHGINAVVGDPAPYVVKQLFVKYRFEGGVEQTAEQREDDLSRVLIITKPKEVGSDGFFVQAVYYGTGLSWVDVTKQVKSLARGRSFILRGYGDGVRAFGVDPAKNYSKRIVVRYRYDGKEAWKDFGDGQDILLP